MKTLNLALILTLIPQLVFAQSMQTETNNNEIMRNNSAQAQEILNKKNAGKPIQEIRTIGGGTPPAANLNLTDQDRQMSENYIHQGRANDIIKENCSGSNSAVCNGREGKHKFMGMDPALMQVLAKSYAMFGALGGDMLGISKGEKALEADKVEAKKIADEKGDGSKPEEPDKKANDYCKYIPTVTEGLATAVQTAKTNELSGEIGNGDTAQKDSLLKASKSHDSRAKMAQIQAAGWWGGAACYGTMAATGQFAVDKNLVIKMGAATLLGAFYQNEVAANKDYADKTKKIADSLPGKGDCNPITDNLCYCSQPSTENDATYCAKGLHAKKLAQSSYRIACTNDQMKLDPQCACEKNNTCFDRYLENQGAGALELGGLAYGNSPYSSIRSLARGELVGGTVNSSSYDKTAALAKRSLRELASKIPVTEELTKDQKTLASGMVAQGVPANVAALMAQNPTSQAATNAAMAKFSGASNGYKMAEYNPAKKSNIVDFSGGNGLGYKGNTKAATGGGADEILSKLKGGKAAPTNAKVLEFVKAAEAQARNSGQIRQNDTPLFEIISLRYQTSGRKLLEVDASN